MRNFGHGCLLLSLRETRISAHKRRCCGVGLLSSYREPLMNDHSLGHTGDQTSARRPLAPGVGALWGSDVARAAVRRTCREVTLRCQRVLARHYPGEDNHRHVTIGDPDPGPALGHPACRFIWEETISADFVLLWYCTRALGHHGQHLAGTGQRVAALYPNVRARPRPVPTQTTPCPS